MLSIVIPVYNAEKYVEESVASLLGQYHRNIEIILVDDGSTDRGPAIMSRLASRHRRVTLIVQENAGPSAARNAGIRVARGRYLTFVDSDDLVTAEGFARGVRTLERTGSDFAILPYRRLRGRKTEPMSAWIADLYSRAREGVTIADDPEMLVHANVASKIYRRSFWDASDLHFAEGVLYEDQEVTARAHVAARAVDVVPVPCYDWRITPGSITREMSEQSMRSFLDAVDASLDVLQQVPGAAEARIAQLLSNDIPMYIRALPRVRDEGYESQLLDRLPALIDRADSKEMLRTVANDAHVAYEYIRQGRRDDLHSFLTHDGLVLNHHDGSLQPEGPVIHLPGWDDPSIRREAFVLAERQTPLDTMIMRARWTGDRELTLTLRAGLRHVESPDETPQARAWLVTDGGRVDVPITLADERFGQHHPSWRQTYDRSTWNAVIDVGTLAAGSYALEVEVTIAGRTRTATVERIDPESSASALAPRRINRRTWLLDVSNGLQLRAQRRSPRDRVSGVVIDSIDLQPHAVTVAGTAPGASGQSLGVELTSSRLNLLARDLVRDGDAFTATFDTSVDVWGRGPTALPVGDYTVRVLLGAQSITPTAGPDLLASLPHDRAAGKLSAVLVAQADHGVAMRLVKPRRLEEQRMYTQRAIRHAYRAADVAVDPDVALFQTYWAEVATDSPRAIHDELRRRNPQMRLYWGVLDHSVPLPEGAIPLVAGSQEWYDVLASAKYIVKNTEVGAYTKLRPGQVYVQTFHGQPFKRMGAGFFRDVERWPEFRVNYECTERRSDYWSLILTPYEGVDELYRDNYFYDGPVHDQGLPRTDALVGERAAEARRSTREQLGIRDDQIAILHAATWREDRAGANNTSRDIQFVDLEKLASELGPEYVILQRSHGSVARGDRRHGDRPGVIDVTDHPEINDLIVASDAAILDYSSLRFDYALTGRPMVFLVPDLERYEGELRGFLFDFRESAPGPLVTDQPGVLAALRDLHGISAAYADDYARFNERFNRWHDGRAAERVVDRMLGDFA